MYLLIYSILAVFDLKLGTSCKIAVHSSLNRKEKE